MSRDIFFVECQNSACGLRFPLDLATFEGKFCPRCGSSLRKVAPGLRFVQPTSAEEFNKCKLIGLLDNVRSSFNVGSIFRSADGTRMSHLHLCGITPTPNHSAEIAKTALGAQASVSWSYHANAVSAVKSLKEQGCKLVALEVTQSAMPISAIKVLRDEPIVLMVGNEPAGLDPELVALSDEVVYLPMLGLKESLNVAVSFSIAAYWLRLRS